MIHNSHNGSWFDVVANLIIWLLAAFNKSVCGFIVYWVSIFAHEKMIINLSNLYQDLQIVAIVLAIFVSFCTGVKYIYNFIMWLKKRKNK
jgi:hypothetical protein